MENAVIAQWGGFGAIFIIVTAALGAEYRRLRIKYDQQVEARVADAREVTAATLAATKEFNEMVRESDTDLKVVLTRIESTLAALDSRLDHIEDQTKRRVR